MTDRCFLDEDLERLAGLPAGDPQLAHAERCGRCLARLAAFREFMDPSLPSDANEEDAVARISETLRREMRGKEAEARPTVHTSAGLLARLRSALWTPTLRPVWIAAAIVLAVVSVRQARLPIADTDLPSTQRGESDTEWITVDSMLLENGDIQVTWDSVTEADGYLLIIMDTGLMELDRIDVGRACTATLRASLLADLPDQEVGLLWRVVAIKNGKQIARSALHSIEPD